MVRSSVRESRQHPIVIHNLFLKMFRKLSGWMSNHSFTWSRWVLLLKVYMWNSELYLTWCTFIVLFLAFVLFTTIKPMARLFKSREHLKSCWWFLPLSYYCSDETTSQHNTSRSTLIFPLSTHFCKREPSILMFVCTSVTVRNNHAAETEVALGRQYHQVKLESFISNRKSGVFGPGKAL